MYNLFWGLCFIAFVVMVVYIVKFIKKRKKDSKLAGHFGMIAFAAFMASMLFYWVTTMTPQGQQNARNESRESSIEAVKDKKAEASSAAKQSSLDKKAAFDHTHGLKGLKYQADKYLKKDSMIATYHPVTVKGYDSSKPYVANIIFKANDENKGTMQNATLSILKGVQKVDYKDFSNIKISFNQEVTDDTGHDHYIPVLGYSFKPSTIAQLKPGNMVGSNLKHVADNYFDKHVKGD